MPLIVDESKSWRLSHILEGHTSDVKSVHACLVDDEVELVHSASRDETGRSWYRNTQSDFQRGASYQGHRFQNAVVHVGTSSKKDKGSAILGGLDAQMRVFEANSSYSDKPQTKVQQTISDHHDNVCHLSVHEGKQGSDQDQTLLISASWDCTSRVWKRSKEDGRWSHLHTLKGHERAVWAAEVVSSEKDKERYLTASADLFIRLWHGEEIKRVFAGHTDVVRAIALLPPQSSSAEKSMTKELPEFYDQEELFVTASNDGSLRVWSLDDRRYPKGNSNNGGDPLRILQSSDNNDILYDVKFAGHLKAGNARLVVSCGEGGLVQGWNTEKGTLVMSIPQPVTSVWSLAIMPLSGDIVTANSDAVVRIFTQRPTATEEHRTLDSISEVSDEQLRQHQDRCQQVASRRVANIEARPLPQDVEPGNLGEGHRYDQILQIDVSDDADPLPLGWNRGGDPQIAAKNFISQHNLPTSYEDQLVAFIEQVGVK